MMRVIALFLALVMSLGIIYPLASNESEARIKRHLKKKKHQKKHRRKIKKYSRAWWRLYRKRMKRKKALAARKRALRLRRAMLAKAKRKPLRKRKKAVAHKPRVRMRKLDKVGDSTASKVSKATPKAVGKSWAKKDQPANAAVQYSVENSDGLALGNAQLTVVGLAGPEVNASNSKWLAGVATSSLRRMVIDRMMREDGWVVNDYQKEINGKKVYVVVAQSPGSGGRVNSRLFYFTEAGGKIYNLSTTAPMDSNEDVAAESEKLLIALQRGNYPAQANLK
jgi:hypothetical protein